MITPQELRIGNIILDRNSKSAIRIEYFLGRETVNVDSAYVDFCTDDNRDIDLSECEYIPLTEEILLKVSDYVDNFTVLIGIFRFKRSVSGTALIFHYETDNSPKQRQITIRNLHSLQNFIYQSTEKELEINL